MGRPAIIKLLVTDTRSSYLVRVINKFMDSTSAGSETIIYDECECDGMCLADDVSSELLDLQQQRDELLAALKVARNEMPSVSSLPKTQTRIGDVIKIVDAAISKAE